MKAIVTCGPSYEPIDRVRRITYFSTGQLGIVLSSALAAAGFATVCLRGVAATHSLKAAGAAMQAFTTNDDLANQLRTFAQSGEVAAVFHTAALSDYRVSRIADASGREVRRAKIASRCGALTIQLEPSPKLIANLRAWFPHSLIVGCKHELDGSQTEAVEKARRQVVENRTDGCIVNGKAYGRGFGFVQGSGCREHFADKQGLCEFLVAWLSETRGQSAAQHGAAPLFDAV